MPLPCSAYAITFLIAAMVGSAELVARYRDAPLDAVRRLPALFYMAINGVAGLVALRAIDVFDWTFGAQPGVPVQYVQVAAASLAGMAVLRSAVFTVRIGSSDVHAGPNALIKIILDTADQAVDRGRAERRSKVVQELMAGIDFEKAKKKLPSDCLALMQNVSKEDQEAVTREVTTLEDDSDLDEMPRARLLGLVLINVVGENVLRASVDALGDEIKSVVAAEPSGPPANPRRRWWSFWSG